MTGAAARLVTRATRWYGCLAVVAMVGCAASQDQTEEALNRLLIEYMEFQEIHFAEQGRYANDIATTTFAVPPELTISIVASSATGHGAVARSSGGTPTVMCALWVGDPLPGLENEAQAAPVCGAPERFEQAITAPAEAAPVVTPSDQVPPAPERPPVFTTPPVIQSGVLLGLHDRPHQTYRTLWIAGHGDSAAVLASGPGLLVPRSDGFWWVNEESQDCNYVVAGPAAGWPDGAVANGGVWAGAIPEECSSDYGGYQSEIFLVGPDYMSFRFYGDAPSGRAVDHIDEYYVMSLDSLTQWVAIPVERFFPQSALAPFMEMVEQKADSMGETSSEECGWGEARSPPPRRWWVVRGRGRWGLVGQYESFYWCGSFTVSASIAVPPELVGHDQLFPDWAAVTAVVPDAEDAVSSPRRDLLVAQTYDSLYAFHVDGDVVGRRVLAVEARGTDIVMVQWAVGRHVQRWTDEVWELLNQLPNGDAR
jgi:hypothetical protein